jgi:Fe-S-cluster containining protein
MLGEMTRDSEFVQIVDAAMAEAVRKSGEWIACKPGCTDCCMGPFPISQLDAARLRTGLRELQVRDPDRAARVRERAKEFVERTGSDFPGDLTEEQFEALADEEPCPALDPETGMCDLYEARPITCRTFGPAVSWGSGALGVCELCYRGATDEEIARCKVDIDPGGMEDELLEGLAEKGQTIVAFALR